MNLKVRATIKYLNEKTARERERERERERVKELEEKPSDVFLCEKAQLVQANLKPSF